MKSFYLHRVIITAKDIQNIKGCRERAARYLLAAIRRRFGKEQGTYVTIDEFCRYTGLKEEDVRAFLQ